GGDVAVVDAAGGGAAAGGEEHGDVGRVAAHALDGDADVDGALADRVLVGAKRDNAALVDVVDVDASDRGRAQRGAVGGHADVEEEVLGPLGDVALGQRVAEGLRGSG